MKPINPQPDASQAPTASLAPPRLMSRAEVERLTGLSTSSLYRAMREGEFPEPLRIGRRAVRWRADEVGAWIEGRPRASGIVGTAA